MFSVSYLFDCRVQFVFVGVDDCLEVVLIVIVFGVEVEDDSSELGHLFAHFVVQFRGCFVHFG